MEGRTQLALSAVEGSAQGSGKILRVRLVARSLLPRPFDYAQGKLRTQILQSDQSTKKILLRQSRKKPNTEAQRTQRES